MAAYSMTTLVAEIRRTISEPTARLFTDEELQDWVDEAARKVSALTLCYELIRGVEGATYSASRIIGTIDSASPIIKVEAVVLDADAGGNFYGMQRIQPTQVGHGECGNGSTGAPKFWFHFADNIVTWPPTNDTDANFDIYLYALYDDFTTTMPDELQHLMIDYVLACCYTKMGKHSMSGVHMQKFMQACMLARADRYAEKRLPDSLDMTRIPDRTVQVS